MWSNRAPNCSLGTFSRARPQLRRRIRRLATTPLQCACSAGSRLENGSLGLIGVGWALLALLALLGLEAGGLVLMPAMWKMEPAARRVTSGLSEVSMRLRVFWKAAGT